MHTLIIPATLGNRLEDRKFRMICGISELESCGVLLLLWKYYSDNATDSMPDDETNRHLLNESLHAKDDCVAALIESGVLLQKDEGHGVMLTPKDYSLVNKPDNARSKGGHGRAASKAYQQAKSAAVQVVRVLETQQGGLPFIAELNSQDKNKAVAILITLVTSLGRRALNLSDYTEELICDVCNLFRSSDMEEDSLRVTFAWIRRNVDLDYRLALPLPMIIRQWASIKEDAAEDRAPRPHVHSTNSLP